MKNNNHHQTDLPCAFADSLVAVLYGEATAAEQQTFERHAAHCAVCRAEFAAFGAVRNTLGEWRETSFAPLETPPIELPTTSATQQIEKISWLTAAREFLFPSNNIWQGAGVYAATAICGILIAVFGFALINRPENQLANANSAPINTPAVSSSATPDKKLDNEVAIVAPQEKNKKLRPLSSPESTEQPRTAQRPVSQPMRRAPQPAAPKSKTTLRKTRNSLDDAPLDDEDDSIRLSDLFEEISSTD